MNATGSRERANDGKLKRLVADLTLDKSMVCQWSERHWRTDALRK